MSKRSGGITGCKDKTSSWHLNGSPDDCLVHFPCMAIDVSSVQYNGGFLPDIILLTQCYYHRGNRLNAMKRFCLCSL